MKEVLIRALSGLAEEKPCHLLGIGIGKIKDIFIAVKQGFAVRKSPVRNSIATLNRIKAGDYPPSTIFIFLKISLGRFAGRFQKTD
jgi:hypothetical protein